MKELEPCFHTKADELDKVYRQIKELLDEKAIHNSAGDYLHPVFGAGCITPVIMLIGEAPGKEEAASGIPFVGKAGRTLTDLLDMIGVSRDEIYISNTVKYRPWTKTERGYKNRTPSRAEIEDQLSLLKQEIEIVEPQILVTLGNTPLYAICRILGLKYEKIGTMHGKMYSGADCFLKLYPAYHPASCIYNRSLLQTLEDDMHVLSSIIEQNRIEA